MAELRINMKVDKNICRMSAIHSHGLKYSKDKSYLVTRRGEKLPTVSMEEAARMPEEFIASSNFLMCHGDQATDFTTL